MVLAPNAARDTTRNGDVRLHALLSSLPHARILFHVHRVRALTMAERPHKKRLKALKRAAKEAARAQQTQRAVTDGVGPVAGPIESVAVDHFLQAYGELTNATVELYKRLDQEDPRHEQVREALARTQQLAASVLSHTPTEADTQEEAQVDASVEADAGVEPDAGIEPDAVNLPLTSGSVELVRTARIAGPRPVLRPVQAPPKPSVAAPHSPRLRLPDESFLARYLRVRRATHRWPDEAGLARYLRARRLPDESTLRRYLRRRRELYRLYAAGSPE